METKSTHQALIYQVDKIESHPNADQLELLYPNNYCCAIRKGQFKEGDTYCFIVPDTVVDGSLPEFSFLGEGKHRIKVKKLHGMISQGLIVPFNGEVGQNVWDELKLERYEPEMKFTMQDDCRSGPSIPKYDIDSINKYVKYISGEVVATEKVHGANARYMFKDELFVGSRTMWKKQNENNLWWKCLTPEMEELCRAYPSYVLYGEVFGQVQDLKYERKGVEFIAFDILKPDFTYVDYDEFAGICDRFGVQRVPELYRGEFDYELLKAIAEEPSKLYNGGKEGLVVRAIPERVNLKVGRLSFKIVSNWYYMKGS